MKKFVDGIQIKELINSKTYYTWFLCIDGEVRRVKTFDYCWLREAYMVSA